MPTWAMEDLPEAREPTETIEGADLYLYPGRDICSQTTARRTMTRVRRRWSSSASSLLKDVE
jgi:hypothetical protein